MRGSGQTVVIICHGIGSTGHVDHKGRHFCAGEPAIILPPGRREKDLPNGKAFLAFFLFVHAGSEAALPGVTLFIAFATRITKVTGNSLVSHFLFPFISFQLFGCNRLQIFVKKRPYPDKYATGCNIG
jgi:hypothetical protein